MPQIGRLPHLREHPAHIVDHLVVDELHSLIDDLMENHKENNMDMRFCTRAEHFYIFQARFHSADYPITFESEDDIAAHFTLIF